MRIDLVDLDKQEIVKVTLSRRNLRALLAKLDGHPASSACTITKQDESWDLLLVVSAEEDEAHYGSRGYGPGPMAPETEARL